MNKNNAMAIDRETLSIVQSLRLIDRDGIRQSQLVIQNFSVSFPPGAEHSTTWLPAAWAWGGRFLRGTNFRIRFKLIKEKTTLSSALCTVRKWRRQIESCLAMCSTTLWTIGMRTFSTAAYILESPGLEAQASGQINRKCDIH